MTEQKETPEENPLFYQVVLTFHTAAWQQMGKVVNPFTQKSEVNLEAASLSIDMLDMLRSKTKGNLTPEEDKFLERVLSDLKLNYIEELKKPRAEEKETESAEPETEEKTAETEGEKED